MKNLTKLSRALWLASGLCLFAGIAQAQNYAVDWHTITGGGGTSTNSTYAVAGTIGQADAGLALSDGYYTVDQGFWSVIAALQTQGAPRLNVALTLPNAILSWPVSPAGFGLQQSTSVTVPSWSNVTNVPVQVGGQWQVAVPAAGNHFYRLKNHLPAETITVTAGAAAVTAPFVFSGGYISQSVLTTDPNAGGRAAFSVNLPSAGTWLVSGLVNAVDDSANSFFLNVDAEPQEPLMIWDVALTSGFELRPGSWRGEGGVPKIFSLPQGAHTIVVRGREANTQLQSISIYPYP